MKHGLFGLALSVAVVLCGSTDAYSQWYSIPQFKYSNIYCMIAVNDSTVFIGGDNALLMRSTDNGAAWTNVMGKTMYVDTVLSLAAGGDYVFAGANGIMSFYRSSDAGDTWSAANNGLPSSAQVNAITGNDRAVYCATNFGVYKSSDGGGTWEADTGGLPLSPFYMYVTPGGTVGLTMVDSTVYTLGGGGMSGVYRQHAGDSSWTSIGKMSGFAMTSIDSNVFIATANGVYVYGGGTTWNARNNGLPFSDSTGTIAAAFFAKYDSLLVLYAEYSSTTSFGRALYATTDTGKTWHAVNDTALGNVNVNSAALTGSYLFVGTGLGAWRVPINDVVTSVENRPHALPDQFALRQNYPNPFNPTTVISFQLSAVSQVTLTVYDVLGRRVKTLVDKIESPGGYDVTFNGAGLASGVYFYRLSTTVSSGSVAGYTKVMKMVLLK